LSRDLPGRIQEEILVPHPEEASPDFYRDADPILAAMKRLEGRDFGRGKIKIDSNYFRELRGGPSGIPLRDMHPYHVLTRIAQRAGKRIAALDKNSSFINDMDPIHRHFQKEVGAVTERTTNRKTGKTIGRTFGRHEIPHPSRAKAPPSVTNLFHIRKTNRPYFHTQSSSSQEYMARIAPFLRRLHPFLSRNGHRLERHFNEKISDFEPLDLGENNGGSKGQGAR
jgi:hypothetical protein